MLKNFKTSGILHLNMFILGGNCLAFEYTLSKVSSDLLGDSVEQWSLTIAVMMFFMGIGSDYQKKITNKFLIDSFIFIESSICVIGALSPFIMLFGFAYTNQAFPLIHYTVIGVLGFLIGMEIPIILRMNEKNSESLKNNLSSLLKADYIGALFGAVVWTLVLRKFFTITEISMILSVSCFSIALLTYFIMKKNLFYPKWQKLAFAMALMILTVLGINYKNWVIYAEQRFFKDRIVFKETSPYQHLVLTESRNREISLYINGHLQFNSFDEHIYHENLVHPAMLVGKPMTRVLILGGGDGLALREVRKYQDVEEIVLCDLDPVMTKLASSNPLMRALNEDSFSDARLTNASNFYKSDEQEVIITAKNELDTGSKGQTFKLKLVNMDARKFLEKAKGKFNKIIIDFPDPVSPNLASLYSKEFYRLLLTRLATDGVIVQQSTSVHHAKEAFLSIGRTMEHVGLNVLPFHAYVPSLGDWGYWLASISMKKEEMVEVIRNVKLIPVATKYLNPESMRGSLVFGKNLLLSRYHTINTNLDSQIYRFYTEDYHR